MKKFLRLATRRVCLEILFRAIFTLVFLSSRGHWRVWRRNSLALGYWSEKSDLDVTLFSKTASRVPGSTLRLWRFFRRFGEWAAFTAEDQNWLAFANPFELARDPLLVRAFGAEPGRPTVSQAFVYWHRMFGSDNLLRSGSASLKNSRKRKWEFHRGQIESATELTLSTPFPEFVDEMGTQLAPVPRSEWSHLQYFLSPHIWLTNALHGRLETCGTLNVQPSPLLSIARDQVHWEYWGLLGQLRLQKNFLEVHQHLDHLAKLFANTDGDSALRAAFLHHIRVLETEDGFTPFEKAK